MRTSAFRLALFLTLALLAVFFVERWHHADTPRPATEPKLATPQSSPAPAPQPTVAQVPGRAVFAPVRRVMPKTPPLPEAILLAGDVEEPNRAPDQAPAPGRRDSALALMYLAGDAVAVAKTEAADVPAPVAAMTPPRTVSGAPSGKSSRHIDFDEGRMALKGPIRVPAPRPAERPAPPK